MRNQKRIIEGLLWAVSLGLLVFGVVTHFEAEAIAKEAERHERIAEAQQKEIELLQSALRETGSAIIRTDFKGTVNYWGDNAVEIFEWLKNEASGRNIHEPGFIMPESLRPRHSEAFSRAVIEGASRNQIYKIDCTAITKSGKPVRIHFTTRPIDGGFLVVVEPSDRIKRLFD